MDLPLNFSDISLWLAVMAILLLVTSELLASPTGPLRNVAIEKKRLRLVALALGLGFMITVVMRAFNFT
jgi:dipeptide/tripeptide permease